MNAERRKSYVKRIITIYIISTAIYFPFIFRESLLSIVSIIVFGWTPAVPLFLICLSTKVMLQIDKLRQLRKTTDVVYIIHVWVITIVQRFSEAKSIWRFLMVTGISFIIALIIVLPIKKAKNGNGKIMSVIL